MNLFPSPILEDSTASLPTRLENGSKNLASEPDQATQVQSHSLMEWSRNVIAPNQELTSIFGTSNERLPFSMGCVTQGPFSIPTNSRQMICKMLNENEGRHLDVTR